MFKFFEKPPQDELKNEIKEKTAELEVQNLKLEQSAGDSEEGKFAEEMEKASQIEKDIDALEKALGVGENEIMEIYESMTPSEAQENVLQALRSLSEEELQKLGIDVEKITASNEEMAMFAKDHGGKVLRIAPMGRRLALAASLLMVISVSALSGVDSAKAGLSSEDLSDLRAVAESSLGKDSKEEGVKSGDAGLMQALEDSINPRRTRGASEKSIVSPEEAEKNRIAVEKMNWQSINFLGTYFVRDLPEGFLDKLSPRVSNILKDSIGSIKEVLTEAVNENQLDLMDAAQAAESVSRAMNAKSKNLYYPDMDY